MIRHSIGTRTFTEGSRLITFEEIYRTHWHILYSVGDKITGDENVTYDLVQEVFLNFLEKYEGKEIDNVGAYLMQSLRHECFQWLRRNKIADKHLVQINLTLAESTTENDINLQFLREKISALVATMPERPREIFQLSRYEHLPIKDIAIILKLNRRTVENHLSRALRILRDGLDKQ